MGFLWERTFCDYKERTCTPDEIIFMEGQKGMNAFVVRSGLVEISTKAVDNRVIPTALEETACTVIPCRTNCVTPR